MSRSLAQCAVSRCFAQCAEEIPSYTPLSVGALLLGGLLVDGDMVPFLDKDGVARLLPKAHAIPLCFL
ncbi:MAG: hypothetical protein MJZ60_04950 [Bacteroidaceae bacterium]|nr:hypothetical protein [Bacteroidaceae bacterium]